MLTHNFWVEYLFINTDISYGRSLFFWHYWKYIKTIFAFFVKVSVFLTRFLYIILITMIIYNNMKFKLYSHALTKHSLHR